MLYFLSPRKCISTCRYTCAHAHARTQRAARLAAGRGPVRASGSPSLSSSSDRRLPLRAGAPHQRLGFLFSCPFGHARDCCCCSTQRRSPGARDLVPLPPRVPDGGGLGARSWTHTTRHNKPAASEELLRHVLSAGPGIPQSTSAPLRPCLTRTCRRRPGRRLPPPFPTHPSRAAECKRHISDCACSHGERGLRDVARARAGDAHC